MDLNPPERPPDNRCGENEDPSPLGSQQIATTASLSEHEGLNVQPTETSGKNEEKESQEDAIAAQDKDNTTSSKNLADVTLAHRAPKRRRAEELEPSADSEPLQAILQLVQIQQTTITTLEETIKTQNATLQILLEEPQNKRIRKEINET